MLVYPDERAGQDVRACGRGEKDFIYPLLIISGDEFAGRSPTIRGESLGAAPAIRGESAGSCHGALARFSCLGLPTDHLMP